MKHGSEWYKRDPLAYLGGVQGLTIKQHAVYAVVLDLIYVHGGSINNDPAWIAGWISDMGAAAVRRTIESLVEMGKLTFEGNQITQKRAKNEAKTKEILRENQQEIGRKGGKKSAEIRAAAKENRELDEANASSENQPEKRREEKKGEGLDKSNPPPTAAGGLPVGFMEKLVDALGFDPHAELPPLWASKKGRDHVAAWLPVHGEERVIDVARESRRKHPEPPSSPQALDHHLAKPPAAAPAKRAEPIETARFWAEKIAAGKFVTPSSVRPDIARLMLSEGLVTEDQLREKGIAA